MVDIVTPKTRSRMMAGVRGKNTKPELSIRKALHRLGFRYRLHVRTLPGKPDLVFPKYKAVIQINGCFWHGHSCHLFKWPSTRKAFWKRKIQGNKERDRVTQSELTNIGWRTLIVWECALKGKSKLSFDTLIESISNWLNSEEKSNMEIEGESNQS